MLRDFEQARDEHTRRLMGNVDGRKSIFINMERRQSYVNLETLLTEENEIVEEHP